MPSKAPHRVVAVAYDHLCTFEFGIATEIFKPQLRIPGWYDFRVCAVEQGLLRASGGIKFVVDRGVQALRKAQTIVIPGWRNPDEVPPEPLIKELRVASERGARIITLCSGVFVLAAAGLLAGKFVTTHWRYVRQLIARYPDIRVKADVLYVESGNILTAAGSAAGIDLCLEVVRRDFGTEIANEVARRLVMPPHREGGQAQYIPFVLRDNTRGSLAGVLQWARSRLQSPLSVKRLAKQASMSPRTFARRFAEETGTTPHRWLTHQRLLLAQRRLESTNESIDEVAESVGLNTAATLRFHFRNSFQTSPVAYRKRFSTTTDRPN